MELTSTKISYETLSFLIYIIMLKIYTYDGGAYAV